MAAAGLCGMASGKVIYVDDDAAGAGDGTSWADAYVFLQDALADANEADKPVEIKVAQGIYKPDQGAAIMPGDRHASFHLISGVTIKGGYAGAAAPIPMRVTLHCMKPSSQATWPATTSTWLIHAICLMSPAGRTIAAT